MQPGYPACDRHTRGRDSDVCRTKRHSSRISAVSVPLAVRFLSVCAIGGGMAPILCRYSRLAYLKNLSRFPYVLVSAREQED